MFFSCLVALVQDSALLRSRCFLCGYRGILVLFVVVVMVICFTISIRNSSSKILGLGDVEPEDCAERRRRAGCGADTPARHDAQAHAASVAEPLRTAEVWQVST